MKEVLSREVGLRVVGDRFYDKRQTSSYPIKAVIFNNKSMLGYFDHHFYEVGFHECLMHVNREVLHDIIRHELAHYITFINYENTVESHGIEFKAFCLRMGWGETVWKATACVGENISIEQAEDNNVLRKVQKLLALATSNNTHEAEQAMIKSQQLLLKHNIDFRNIDSENEDNEKIFLKRVMKQKRENAKMRAIAAILQTFLVNTVYSRFDDYTYLEVTGNATNIEIADYVAHTLQHQLDVLWNQTKKQQPGLKGVIAKNSFFLGVAQGYCNKINFLKKEYDCNTSNALILIEKQLESALDMVYARLRTSRSNGYFCCQSSLLGEQAGRNLNIHPAVDNCPSKSETSYISFQTD